MIACVGSSSGTARRERKSMNGTQRYGQSHGWFDEQSDR